MAKAKAIYFYLLCFLICGSAFSQGDLSQSKRLLLQQTYNGEIGVKEQGGSNRGERVEQYLASVGLGPGYAYCAAFVSWCFQKAGVKAPKSAWVPSYNTKQNIVYQRGEFIKRSPKPGDVFMIWYAKLKRPAHIGFVDRWEDKWVVTVDGNTNNNGSREGDGVYRKQRLQRQVWAVSNFID